MSNLRVENVSKVYPDGTRALDGVTLEAEPGRVVVLLGPSGCGKSTLLRVIAGLDQPTSGTLSLGNVPIDRASPRERSVGFVFQNYALYPHLTVRDNLALNLEVARVPRQERESRVQAMAESLAISPLLGRKPSQLSGGQQQRVALGRALVRNPKLLLLDEPLSSLDAALREEMRAELQTVFARRQSIVLYVTHDQTEAMSLADEIAVMRDGRILQQGPPLELYRQPAHLFVAEFVGTPRMNTWAGRREGSSFVVGRVRLPLPPSPSDIPIDLVVGIRPEDIDIVPQNTPGSLPANIDRIEPLGAFELVTLSVEDLSMKVMTNPGSRLGPAGVRWPDARLHWFAAASGERVELESGSTFAAASMNSGDTAHRSRSNDGGTCS